METVAVHVPGLPATATKLHHLELVYQHRHLEVLPLGDLYKAMPDLRVAATGKLVARQAQQLEGLCKATQEVTELAEGFR